MARAKRGAAAEKADADDRRARREGAMAAIRLGVEEILRTGRLGNRLTRADKQVANYALAAALDVVIRALSPTPKEG